MNTTTMEGLNFSLRTAKERFTSFLYGPNSSKKSPKIRSSYFQCLRNGISGNWDLGLKSHFAESSLL
jgi:hypothetical protein